MALPTVARDFSYKYEGQTLTYTVISDGNHSVKTKEGNWGTPGNTVSGTLIIPSVVRDDKGVQYTVTEIGSFSFSWADLTPSPLTSVTIPNTVTKIGDNAFKGCNFTSIEIPSSVKTMGEGVFLDCQKLISIVLPSSLTSIEPWTFGRCYNLVSIEIPNSVKNIGEHAFDSCKNLATLKLPNSLNTIGYQAFLECSSLTSLVIPSSITTIEDDAFGWCSSLSSLTLPNTLTSIPSAFGDCGLTSLNIPRSVKTIERMAFEKNKLTTLTIPSSVTSVGEDAFFGNPFKMVKIESPVMIDLTAFDRIYNGNSFAPIIVPSDLYSGYQESYQTIPSLSSAIISDGQSFENYYTDGGFDIGLNDTKTLRLGFKKPEILNGFQTDIVLPSGLSIAEKSGELDVTLGDGKAASHVVTASKLEGTNTYRIIVYSSENEVFTSGDDLLRINIKSDGNLRGGDIMVTNTVLSLIGYGSLHPADFAINVPSFIEAKSVTVSPAEATLNLGNTLALTAEVLPANAWVKTLNWTSSNSSVATVSADGVVTPVGKGTVTITATTTDGTNLSASSTITVTNYAQSLTFAQESITLEENETLQLSPVFTPANAESLELEWTSTNPDIAYVDNSNVLHTIVPGEVTVTATNSASGLSASINVVVTPVLYGDANDNNVVAIDDVTTEVKYILEKNPSPFSFKKADVNRDRVVNVLDISRTVGIVLTNSGLASQMRRLAPSNAPAMVSAAEEDIAGNSRMVVLSLANAQNVTAMQGDIELPAGMDVEAITLSTAQESNHIVGFAHCGDNTVRFTVYSLSLTNLTENAPMLEVTLSGDMDCGDREVVINNLYASDADCELYHSKDIRLTLGSHEITGVESVDADSVAYPADVYNIMGVCVKRNADRADVDNLASGVYVINGKKVLIMH